MKMKQGKSRMRFTSFALRFLFVPALVFATGAASASSYDRDETVRKNIPLQGARHIIVVNSRGEVSVVGEKGRGDIALEFTKRIKGRSKGDGDRLLAAMDVEVRRDGGDLVVSAKYPDTSDRGNNVLSFFMQRYAGLDIDIKLAVPQELGVTVTTASGGTELSNTLGPVEITSASGDVRVGGVGECKINVSSGDLEVSDVAGNAFLSSASGDIKASGIKGNAGVRTASGDIELSDIGGDLTGASASGDVTVKGVGAVVFSGTSGSAQFIGVRKNVTAAVSSGNVEVQAVPSVGANFEIRTSSGRIQLTFARTMPNGFVLKAATTSGDISVNLPIKVSKVGRHELSGVVRRGGSVVVLETSSGDITVSEPEE